MIDPFTDLFVAGLLFGIPLGALSVVLFGIARQLKTADERVRASGLFGGLHDDRDMVTGAQGHE